MCVFNEHSLYTSKKDWQKYHNTSMLIKDLLHYLPKYIPYEISFLTASRFLHRNDLPSYGLHIGTRPRPHRSVPTDPVLGFFSRCCRCWACLSTLPLNLNLRLFGIFGLTTPVPPSATPRSRSSTYSTSRTSTLPVGLSAHAALVSSPTVAMLALLMPLSLPLGPRLIQRVSCLSAPDRCVSRVGTAEVMD